MSSPAEAATTNFASRRVQWLASENGTVLMNELSNLGQQAVALGYQPSGDFAPPSPGDEPTPAEVDRVVATLRSVSSGRSASVPMSGTASDPIVSSVNALYASTAFHEAAAEVTALLSTPGATLFLQQKLSELLASGAVTHADLVLSTPTQVALLGIKLPDVWGAVLAAGGVVLGAAGAIGCAVTIAVCGPALAAIAGASLVLSTVGGYWYYVTQHQSVRSLRGENCQLAASMYINSDSVDYGSAANCNQAFSQLTVSAEVIRNGSTWVFQPNTCYGTSQCSVGGTSYDGGHDCYIVKADYDTSTGEGATIYTDNKCRQ
jgi:hypothetical protein